MPNVGLMFSRRVWRPSQAFCVKNAHRNRKRQMDALRNVLLEKTSRRHLEVAFRKAIRENPLKFYRDIVLPRLPKIKTLSQTAANGKVMTPAETVMAFDNATSPIRGHLWPLGHVEAKDVKTTAGNALTEDKVRMIRDKYEKGDDSVSCRTLAKEYGVTAMCISDITSRKTWKDI